MPDIDKIIEQLLNGRRMSESATFSMRSYSDQPLIEKGSDLKARMEKRDQERAERHEREARERRGKTREREAAGRGTAQRGSWKVVEGGKATSESTRPTRESATPSREQKMSRAELYTSILQGLGDFVQAFDEEMEARNRGFSRREPLPEPIRQMRKLEGEGVPRTLAYGSSTAAALFYRQAKLMEDYEDDYAFRGSFLQYYPTYSSMSDSQLRGYFSWRTRVRAGQMEPAPLSFAFLHAYELLMGVGTVAGRQGLEDLKRFGQAYEEADELDGKRLNAYLRMWLKDYAIYHDIPEGYQRKATGEQDAAVLTILRAEHAHLAQNNRRPKIPNAAAQGSAPTDEQLFQALGAMGSYHICTSRLTKQEPELVQAVTRDVFHALVMHCSKRRKTDYVEGLFGYASRMRYTMFSTAVFYEEEPHPDCTVRVSDAEVYECKDGRWWYMRACESTGRSSELGLALHAIDYELRKQLDYAYPLKRREAPKYLWKIVQDTVTQHLERRAEAERRKITIDLSKLGGIRAAAAVTQEALLTDEERGEEPSALLDKKDNASRPSANNVSPTTLSQINATSSTREQQAQPKADDLLTPEEIQLLAGLLEGKPATELLGARAQFLSVVIDSINEKLFDVVGDTVIEQDDDIPHIAEDYLDDVREVLRVADEGDGTSRPAEQNATLASSSYSPSLSNGPAPAVAPTSMAGTPEQLTPAELDGPLTAEEARLLTGLLDGTPTAELLGARAQFLSVVIDSINEKLFDVVGDTVIEFDGDGPCIVEDYLEDVREVLHL